MKFFKRKISVEEALIVIEKKINARKSMKKHLKEELLEEETEIANLSKVLHACADLMLKD